jgi:hypothetical protein
MVEKLRRTSLASLVATAANQQPDMGQTAVFEDPDGNLIHIQVKTQLIGVDEILARITKRLGIAVRCAMSANGLASGPDIFGAVG